MKILAFFVLFSFGSLAMNESDQEMGEALQQDIDAQVEDWIIEILPEKRLELYLQQILVKKARNKAKAKILQELNAIDRKACKAWVRIQGQENVELRIKAKLENDINQLLIKFNLLHE